jgi:hypothetical protein
MFISVCPFLLLIRAAKPEGRSAWALSPLVTDRSYMPVNSHRAQSERAGAFGLRGAKMGLEKRSHAFEIFTAL